MSFELVTLKSDGEVLAPRRDRLHRLDIMALRYLRLQNATSGLRAMEWFAGGRLLHQYVHRVFWRLSRYGRRGIVMARGFTIFVTVSPSRP